MRAGTSLRLLTLLLAAGLLAAAGCGTGTYVDRLDRTRRLQAYLDLLDRELVRRPWHNELFRLRVPRQFSTPPGGGRPMKLAGDEALPGGLRQFFKDLDGVQAAWRTTVRVRGNAQPQPAYLVLASNRNLTKRGRYTLAEARQYADRTIHAMFLACGQARPLRADWDSHELPAGREFAVTRTYTVFTVQEGSSAHNGVPYQLQAYWVLEGEHQFAVMFALPKNVADDEKLTEDDRIGLCLGTLEERPN